MLTIDTTLNEKYGVKTVMTNIICFLFGHDFQVPVPVQGGGVTIIDERTGLNVDDLNKSLCAPGEWWIIKPHSPIPVIISPRPLNFVWCKRCARQQFLRLLTLREKEIVLNEAPNATK
jgi:hypothetical protein